MSPRVEVVPGPGMVLRHGQLCVWVGPQASDALLQFLSQSARNLGPSKRGGQLLADHVGGVLAEGDPEPGAAFVTVGPDGTGAHVALLHGPVRLWTGVRWTEPPVNPGWQRVLMAPAPVVLAGSAGSQPVPGGSHPILDLESGTVPGGGFALIDAGAGGPSTDPAPAQQTAASPPGNGGPDPDDVVAVAFASPDRPDTFQVRAEPTVSNPAAPDAPTSVMPAATGDPTAMSPTGTVPTGTVPTGTVPTTVGLTTDPTVAQPTRPPGVIGLLPPPGGLLPGGPAGPVGSVPVVRGVRCTRRHFNHPDATSCVRCGDAIDPERAVVSGPRPSLGVLVVDDGSLYALDRPYLIGAQVGEDPAVRGGSERPLVLAGDRVAGVHAEIRVSDWTVAVVDRASMGSTHLLVPGSDRWSTLSPFRPSPIQPGTHLAIGSRVLTFVSPWPG